MRILVPLAAVALLSGCAATSTQTTVTSTPSTVASSPAAGLKRTYATTTCADWLTVMTADERMTASRDLIRRLGARDTSGTFAARFVSDISQVCSGSDQPHMSLADVAAGLATIDHADFN